MKTNAVWLSVALVTSGLAIGCGDSLSVVGPGRGPVGASADAQIARDEALLTAADDALLTSNTALTTTGDRHDDAAAPGDSVVDADRPDSPSPDAGALDVPSRDATPGDAAPADTVSASDTGMTDRDARPDASATDAGGARDALATDSSLGAPDIADASAADAVATDAAIADVVAPPDAGAVADVSAPLDVSVGGWDPATAAHVREVRDRGVAAGNRATVFAKIGDSITESGSFLSDVGFGWIQLGAFGSLDATIRYFQATSLEGGNSFNHASACATAGWTTDDALAGGADSPLQRELRAIRPSWALVMYGTNDLDRNTVSVYAAHLNQIADLCESAGTVPVFSTIPDRFDTTTAAAIVPVFNDAIRTLTATRHLPLIEYWGALQTLPRHGVSEDNIHPSVYRTAEGTQPGDFTPVGLMYGYNMRNLTAIQMLDRLRALP